MKLSLHAIRYMSIKNPGSSKRSTLSAVFVRRLESCVCCLWSANSPSTSVEDSLQISLFMQNKPNVKDAQINVSSCMKSKYEKMDTWLSGKNKPNSNPNKPNLKRAKMNVNSFITKDYRKKDDFVVRINKPNFRNGQNERKLNYNKDLQKQRLFSSPKNKPKTNPISNPVLSAVEWANFFKGQNRLPENPAIPENEKLDFSVELS